MAKKLPIHDELDRYAKSHNWSWRPDPNTRERLRLGNSKIKRPELSPKRIEEMKMAEQTAPKKVAKRVTKKSTAKPATTVKKVDTDLIPLKSICQQLKVDPRLARRKLRKAEVSGHDPRNRWSFKKDSTALAKVKEILAA